MSKKRFVVENDNNEVSIRDKLEDNYPFALAYEHIDDADNLIQECLSLVVLLNEQQATIENLRQLVDVSIKADEEFSVFDDLKYIESALTFLIDNGLEDQCVECEREDIHFVAERLRIVLRSLEE